MNGYQSVFRRCEMKYMLTPKQLRALSPVLKGRMEPDDFPESAICNLYYDTPDFQLIRRSLEKPGYKEKLRLRCYGVPCGNDPAFIEIKKKVDGVVYKRRERLEYTAALAYLAGRDAGGDSQIFRELDWFLRFYRRLAPAMCLSYDRLSLRGREDKELRMTIDCNLLWRTEALDLAQGSWGQSLLPPGRWLLEIKIANAMPLWLAEALAENQIFPTGFSKYGAAYQALCQHHTEHQEVKRYA